jgi:hypothetical protein
MSKEKGIFSTKLWIDGGGNELNLTPSSKQ